MNFIKRTPLAISGIALALAALGNLLLPRGEWLRSLCGLLSAAILLLFVLKLALNFKGAKEELKNPIALSTLPTSTMAAMLLCVYAKPYLGQTAAVLWYAAIALHIFIMLIFALNFVIGFSLKNVFPTWFVAGVGIVTASVTSPAMNAAPLGRVLFLAGFAMYLILLPIVIYRMVKLGTLPEPPRPTTAIFTAPASLCLVGCLSSFEPDDALVYFLLTLAVVSYLYVTLKMFSLLRLKFYPTYAAFTFPYVISALAFKMGNAFLVNHGYGFFSFAPTVSEIIAVVVVVYVLIRYAGFMLSRGGAAS